MHTGVSNTISALEKLLIDDADLRELESKIRPYCPFEAMGMVDTEIRHSNFLSYVLDPLRPHGFGSNILRSFLEKIISSSAIETAIPLSRIELHLLDIGDVEVRREWRNIDLLIVIHDTKLVIAVELKINASQHGDQLNKYRKTIEINFPNPEWKHIFVFLYKNSEIPKDELWIPLNLNDLVDSFETVLARTPAQIAARDTLHSYILMMRRRHLTDENTKQIVRRIWGRHEEILNFLIENKPDYSSEIFKAISEYKKYIEKELGTEWALDSKEGGIIRFAYTPWDEIDEFRTSRDWSASRRLVLFELKKGTPPTGEVYLGPGSGGNLRDLFIRKLKSDRIISGHRRGEWIRISEQKLTSFAPTDHVTQIAELAVKNFVKFAHKEADQLNTMVRNAFQHKHQS